MYRLDHMITVYQTPFFVFAFWTHTGNFFQRLQPLPILDISSLQQIYNKICLYSHIVLQQVVPTFSFQLDWHLCLSNINLF